MAKQQSKRGQPSNMPAKTAPTPTSTATGKKPTLRQGLKIAGTDGISRAELNKIIKTTDQPGSKVIQNLDALNRRLVEKDQTGISLNSGAANMLIKNAAKQPAYNTYLGSLMGGSTYNTGPIGKALQRRVGAPGGLGDQGTLGTGLMLGGTAIRPGGRETVRGFGKQYQFSGMPTTAAEGDGTQGTGAGGTGSVGDMGAMEGAIPEIPETETAMTPPSPLISADLANWATGFKAKRSSRKLAGRSAQGQASQRVSPTGTFRGSM